MAGIIAAYHIDPIGHLPARTRYIAQPGRTKYRGMYRNRRAVGHTNPVLTDERSQAWQFSSRKQAQEQVRKFYGARFLPYFTFEKGEVHAS